MESLKLSWTCHVCGRERPDALISVWSEGGELLSKETWTVTWHVNVRYCNDRSSCLEGARRIAHGVLERAPST